MLLSILPRISMLLPNPINDYYGCGRFHSQPMRFKWSNIVKKIEPRIEAIKDGNKGGDTGKGSARTGRV